MVVPLDLGIRGRVALVTAASRGLGYACAEMLAREGARIVISSRSLEGLTRAAERIRSRVPGAEVYVRRVDLASKESVDELFDYVEEELGGLDILVYSTGGPPPGGFFEVSDEEWEYAARLVGFSPLWVGRRAGLMMKRRGWGRMVFIGSITLVKPYPDLATSNIMRMPLIGVVRTLALELAPYGVTVNAVLPSLILTDRVRRLAERRAAEENIAVEEALRRMGRSLPVGRIGRPEELAALVAFLASEHAGFITGALIPVDGGKSIA